MVKYIALFLIPINGPVDINGYELNCSNMTTIEAYTMYARWCPYIYPYNVIYTMYADTDLVTKKLRVNGHKKK